jgi:hypothetical protein
VHEARVARLSIHRLALIGVTRAASRPAKLAILNPMESSHA